MCDIAKALVYIHARELIHRDIKPPNILLTVSYTAKIADFGEVRQARLQSSKRNLVTTVRGTPLYMAPEITTMDGLPTPAADVFSFALILLEIVSGFSTADRCSVSLVKKRAGAKYHAMGKRLPLDLPAAARKDSVSVRGRVPKSSDSYMSVRVRAVSRSEGGNDGVSKALTSNTLAGRGRALSMAQTRSSISSKASNGSKIARKQIEPFLTKVSFIRVGYKSLLAVV